MTLAIIPARGGSRRIPRKNIREFRGEPIIAYSIRAALASKLFDEVWVSTDDIQIGSIARRYGARVAMREPEFARDEVGTQEVTARAIVQLKQLPTGLTCCIYPTAPMISVNDLRRGYDLLKNSTHNYAMSVGTNPLQDAAQFYWGRNDAFVNGWPLIDPLTFMVPIPDGRVCDINTLDDWARADRMWAALPKIGITA